jgi:hypothetical protein
MGFIEIASVEIGMKFQSFPGQKLLVEHLEGG